MSFFNSRKSLVLSFVSIAMALFLIGVMAGSNKIKDYLNEMMTDSITSKPFSDLKLFLPDYFDYLQNSAFWIEVGDFPEFENIGADLQLLKHGILSSLPGVISVNYTSGSDVTRFILSGDQVITTKSVKSELSESFVILGDNLIEKNLYITDFHLLQSTGELGFSVVIELKSSPFMSLSLDISLAALAEHYEQAFSGDAILFSANNYDEFITLPLDVDYINEFNASTQSKSDGDYAYLQGLVKMALTDSNRSNREKPFPIKFEGSDWFVLQYSLNDYGGVIGFIIPESELFFNQYNRVFIIASIPFFIFFILLISLFYLYRYRDAHNCTEEEKMRQLIEKGESKNLEFKSSFRWDYHENSLNKKLEEVILKSIAAFANAHGGTLLIGIDDNGAILGLEKDYSTLKHPNKDSFELHLRNLVSSMYGTFTIKNIDVAFISIDEMEICRIIIKPGSSPLYTVMKGKNGDKQEYFYIRDGNLSRRIESLKEIMEYCRNRFN